MAGEMTFWDHLDVLRADMIRIVVAAVVMGTGAFCLKDFLFDVVLWPGSGDFPTYRLLGAEGFDLGILGSGLVAQLLVLFGEVGDGVGLVGGGGGLGLE